ncbi:MAG: ribosome biogenesis GTP-binding protein YihA/YsxC [bacterium]|nr:ribosome biogenesis GTP-binding protein YihA/YsxC [bacterium]
MAIRSATFVKGVVGDDEILEDGKPHIVFIGRSNVGKSSTINMLTKQKDLARTSSFPGRTQEINIFLINKSFYLVDLPGYGFVRASRETREKLEKLIYWYLFESQYAQKKIVLIIDAYTGPTDSDLEMLIALEEHKKDIVILANKVDKIKKSGYKKQLEKIQNRIGDHKVIPFSAKKNIGIGELMNEIFESIRR